MKRRQRGAREERPLALTGEQRRRQAKIATALASIDLALPGSVEIRRTRCGKPQCRCHSDDAARHGPYIVWTRKVNARTVTKVLSEDELEHYRAWLDNSRRLRDLVDELHKLTLQVVEEQQGRSSRPPRTRSQPDVSGPAAPRLSRSDGKPEK